MHHINKNKPGKSDFGLEKRLGVKIVGHNCTACRELDDLLPPGEEWPIALCQSDTLIVWIPHITYVRKEKLTLKINHRSKPSTN